MSDAVFRDREQAGRRLTAPAERFRREAPVVVAIARGGVPVAVEVATALAAPLDVLVVRKLGDPGARFGAVAEGGAAIVDHDRARALGLGAEEIAQARDAAMEQAEAEARRLRGGAGPRDLVGRTVLLVDDGVGTGDSALAAARTVRRLGAARIVLAVPVARAAALTRLAGELDDVVCLETGATGPWYEHDGRLGEDAILAALRPRPPQRGSELHIPEAARGLIVAGGADETVRRTFRQMGFATFDLPAHADRGAFAHATELVRRLPSARLLALGYFGFGDAAEPAVLAGSHGDARAVVTAGGRPDRPDAALERLQAPTLLIIGGEDRLMARLARGALRRIAASDRQLALVPGAGHHFTEPGAREQVAHLAGAWFARHL